MSKVLSGDHSWTYLTESSGADAALVWNEESFTDIPATNDRERHSLLEPAFELQHSSLISTIAESVSKDKNGKHRFGLPPGFVSRLSRFGRSVLFEDNIYRLPDGSEFIPQPPRGTLGSRNHQYSLLSLEQFEKGQRGSVYVRTDGRIFDYAFDHAFAERDLFDTGFTIHDLERTGRYAPAIKSRSASRKSRKARRNKKKTGFGIGK